MKKPEFTEADQKAAKVAAANIVVDQSFWDRVQDQWERMTAGPEIKPRQPAKSEHTQ